MLTFKKRENRIITYEITLRKGDLIRILQASTEIIYKIPDDADIKIDGIPYSSEIMDEDTIISIGWITKEEN